MVITTPGAILTDWRDSVKGIVTDFMPGQEIGNSIASVLFGDVNPSARLPLTFPITENDVNFSQNQWPGVNG